MYTQSPLDVWENDTIVAAHYKHKSRRPPFFPRRPHRYDNEANPLFLRLSQLSLQSARNKEKQKTAAFFFFLCGTHCRHIFFFKERETENKTEKGDILLV
jgi:hypothetical protein